MWIVIAIAGYFLLAVAETVDKYILSGPLPSPKVYAFFVGILGSITLLLIPFGFLEFPSFSIIVIAFGAGVIRVFALFALFSGLRKFEVSRIVPALGATLPIFSLAILFVLTQETAVLSTQNFPAFLFLVGGGVAITIERKKHVTAQSLIYATTAAFLFAAFFVLSKFVYDAQSFLSGLIWIALGSMLGSVLFLGTKDVQKLIKRFLSRKKKAKKIQMKASSLVIGSQIIGGSAILLQSLAIDLVPRGLLPFVNALEGVSYFFIFAIALFFSFFFPSVLKEKVSSKIIAQKFVAIVFIAVGLILLAL